MSRTFNETKALAEAAARRHQERQRAIENAEALRRWRAPFALTRWMAAKQNEPTTAR